jgi:hypothetical protein
MVFRCSCLLFLLPTLAPAAISVSGVAHEQKYAAPLTITVAAPAGFTTTATLNGEPFPVGVATALTEVRLHELEIVERDGGGAITDQRWIVFILRNPERGNSEDGLPTFTPYPLVDSAASEFTNAVLKVMMPASFPAGMDLPVSVRVEDDQGNPLFLNGTWRSAAFPGQTLRVRRGFGAGRLTGLPPGEHLVVSRLGGATASQTVTIEANPVWTSVSGVLAGAEVEWPAGARIAVVGDLTVPAGTRLRVEAGAAVRLELGVDVRVEGRLEIRGTPTDPVAWVPAAADRPWGGVHLLGAAAPRVDASGLLLTGSGEDADWFSGDATNISTHQDAQAAFTFEACAGAFTNACLFDLHGQVFAARSTDLRFIRSHFHRAVAGGQLNGSRSGSTYTSFFTAERSHWSEFPVESPDFADNDNDGLYLNGGLNQLDRTSWGWCKDDGIDTGGSNTGTLIVRDSWAEGCFHEAMSMSGNKYIAITNSVFINNGQALEDGYEAPTPVITGCLTVENMVGLRFGDNYGSGYSYNGFLTAANSISVFNRFKDVWGYVYRTPWSYRADRMSVTGCFFTAATAEHPGNFIWNPLADGWRLDAHDPAPGAPRGIAVLTPGGAVRPLSDLAGGFTVGLSAFSSRPVSARWVVNGRTAAGAPEIRLAEGTLHFAPGQIYRPVAVSPTLTHGMAFVRVTLEEVQNAEAAPASHGPWFMEPPPGGDLVVVPLEGTIWKYWDADADPGADWRQRTYDDSGWASGPAELGYGNGDEATVIRGGSVNPRPPTAYFRHRFHVTDTHSWTELAFRLRYDDGAAVYLNGSEVLRANLSGTAGHTTYTGSTSANNALAQGSASVGLLQPGENVLAVEVHQANLNSSDLSFALELVARRPRGMLLALLPDPRQGGVILHDPADAHLEWSPDLEQWEDAPGENPRGLPDTETRGYFRLRL